MAVTVYRSTDAGAPGLANVAGSFIAMLRACLVDGYGSKAPAGWSAEFTGTNLIALKQGTGGNNRYLRIYDNTIDGNNSRSAYVRAYESMTAISTGTGACPTTGQVAGNGASFAYFYTPRSDSSASWIVVATPYFFHVVAEQGDAPGYNPEYMAFGKFNSDLAGDVYNDILLAGSSGGMGFSGYLDPATGTPGAWCMRSDTGVSGAVVAALLSETRVSMTATSNCIGVGSNFNPYPDRVLGGLVQSQMTIMCDGFRRGRIPGLWETHQLPQEIGGHRTTWSGASGSLWGKSFQIFGPIGSFVAGGGAHVTLETSDTWS